MQNSLFTSDFHNGKIFVRTTEVKQCFLITKIVKITKIALYFLLWHCITLQLHSKHLVYLRDVVFVGLFPLQH